ncbi:MAG: hypothetical protein IJJ44_07300 [Solobacterium sp.]|nr:hypothetical protein [Solobacterium sp.]
MNNLIIGKNNQDELISLELPSVTVVTGDKLSGKTFFIRTAAGRIVDGKVLLLTNKPDSYHGLGETFIHVDKENTAIDVQEKLTIIDLLALYEDDPEHILAKVMSSVIEFVHEGDLVVVDEIYPYLRDDRNKYSLLKMVEDVRGAGVSVVVTTNQNQLFIDEGSVILEDCDNCLILLQSKETAVTLAENYGAERGKYELERYYDTFEFGKGLLLKKDGEINFIEIGAAL